MNYFKLILNHQYKLTATGLVTSVGTINSPVASSVAFNTLTAITTELIRPAVYIQLIKLDELLRHLNVVLDNEL